MHQLHEAQKSIQADEDEALKELMKVLEDDDTQNKGNSALGTLQRYFIPFRKGYIPT